MIPTFIPSKNRALQLQSTLESIDRYANGIFDITIMYTYSDDNFKKGYEKLINSPLGKKCKWLLENNCEDQFYGFLNNSANNDQNIMLFTDDCIFYKKSSITENYINKLLKDNHEVWTIILALGLNIDLQDYTNGERTYPPSPSDYKMLYDKFMKWNFRNYFACKHSGNRDIWGFDSGFNGWIYRAKDLLWLADGGSFKRIILWEHMVCNNGRRSLHNKDYCIAPLNSEVCVQQVNSVHEFGFHGRNFLPLDQLNTAWLNGYKISLDSIDFSDIRSIHVELPFKLEKEK